MKALLKYTWYYLRGYRRLMNPHIKRGTSYLRVSGVAWVRQNRHGIHILYEEEEK